MAWDLNEALSYYRSQGAPANQTMLVSLLKEIQQECGGSISRQAVAAISQAYALKENLLLAVIRRIPSLRLEDTHCLEICCGDTCGKSARLAEFVERTYGKTPEKFTVKYVNCLRQCGKGPNIRWDGVLYHHADEALIRKLVEQ